MYRAKDLETGVTSEGEQQGCPFRPCDFLPLPLPLAFAPWRKMLVGSDVCLVWPCLTDKDVDLEMREFLRGAVGDCGPSCRENRLQTALLLSAPSIILIYGGKLLLEFEKWIFDPKFPSH